MVLRSWPRCRAIAEIVQPRRLSACASTSSSRVSMRGGGPFGRRVVRDQQLRRDLRRVGGATRVGNSEQVWGDSPERRHHSSGTVQRASWQGVELHKHARLLYGFGVALRGGRRNLTAIKRALPGPRSRLCCYRGPPRGWARWVTGVARSRAAVRAGAIEHASICSDGVSVVRGDATAGTGGHRDPPRAPPVRTPVADRAR